MITKFYKVAGLTFSFSLPESEKLWSVLTNYAPFEVDGGEVIFSMEYAHGVPEEKGEVYFDPPAEPGETIIRMYRHNEGEWLFEFAPMSGMPMSGYMVTSLDFSSAKIYFVNNKLSTAAFVINNAAMALYAFSSLPFDVLALHASVIMNGGKAYLFLAKSGTGKSTHSQLWLDNVPGSELMNDDNPVVRVSPDGSVIAYGSPWSGKTPCYRNVSAPVGAFVQIRRCKENKIEKLDVLNAYVILYSSSSGIKLDRQSADVMHKVFEKVLVKSPFYMLDCLPDADAARVCSETVKKS